MIHVSLSPILVLILRVIMSKNPKTTIHITNVIEDRHKLWHLFHSLPGFKRISFHQEFLFVCFDQLVQATNAIDYVQKKVFY